ncbi:MAG: protein kinase domain-containing protein [Bellilinea sp.]
MISSAEQGHKLIAKRYKIVTTLEGGMGVVNFCLDTQEDNFPLALKTFKPELMSNRLIRDRFLREATIWVNLGFHPNIVQAYKALHIADDQSIYIIMQVIPALPGFPNPSLRAKMIFGPSFSIKTGLEITLGIIRGMKYATSVIPTLVHRDLKPENILMGLDGSPKITDFGLAGFNYEQNNQINTENIDLFNRKITQAGGMGTPLYMSPEQWLGHPVDQRSDIYAVGLLLFEICTGQLAVNGNGVDEIFKAHTSGMAISNLQRSNLSPAIKSLLQKCLSNNLHDRFPDWKDFEKNVINILANEFQEPVPTEEIPIDISLNTECQKIESLLAIGAAYISISNFVDALKYFEKAYLLAEKQGFLALQALAIANRGAAYSNQGYFEKAIELFKEAISLFTALDQKNQICYHTGNMGNAYFGLYDLVNARVYLEKAYHLAEALGDSINLARWMGNLGNVYLALGDNNTALRLFQSAYEFTKDTKDKYSLCRHLGGIASAYEGMKEFSKALALYQASLSIAQEISDQQSIGILHASITQPFFCKFESEKSIVL